MLNSNIYYRAISLFVYIFFLKELDDNIVAFLSNKNFLQLCNTYHLAEQKNQKIQQKDCIIMVYGLLRTSQIRTDKILRILRD